MPTRPTAAQVALERQPTRRIQGVRCEPNKTMYTEYYLKPTSEESSMAQEPLATKGNFLHIYDFRVEAGREDEFVRLFEEFDYSDGNPMHKSWAQVKDGVLCRDTEDPQRFFLIAEWSDIVEHAKIRKILAEELKPAFVGLIEGRKFVPKYVEVVSSTPDEILNAAAD
jgi:hypothetical protein